MRRLLNITRNAEKQYDKRNGNQTGIQNKGNLLDGRKRDLNSSDITISQNSNKGEREPQLFRDYTGASTASSSIWHSDKELYKRGFGKTFGEEKRSKRKHNQFNVQRLQSAPVAPVSSNDYQVEGSREMSSVIGIDNKLNEVYKRGVQDRTQNASKDVNVSPSGRRFHVIKVNRYGKRQQRVIKVTEDGISNEQGKAWSHGKRDVYR